MSDDSTKLTQEEIDAQEAEGLPPREVMSLIDPGLEGTGALTVLPIDPVEPEAEETV